ncbi:MAG: DUF1961 family protein [Aristaeellaceae bacterium]
MDQLLYFNRLSCPEDIKDFVLEGQARIDFKDGYMVMENALPAQDGQKANYVLWCPEEFPSNVRIEWDFMPLTDIGLCILFFAARSMDGKDIFDKALQPRTGEYALYHHGDIHTFHVSYYRRKEPAERVFHTCNLRKSYGFHLVAQGADPIPDARDCRGFYHMTIVKKDREVTFWINDLQIFRYTDDGAAYGETLGGGKIGFRQLAPLVAAYRNLSVYAI